MYQSLTLLNRRKCVWRKNALMSRWEYSWGVENPRRWTTPCSDYSSTLYPFPSVGTSVTEQCVISPVLFHGPSHSRKSLEEQTHILWNWVLVLFVSLIREEHCGHKSSNAWHTRDQVEKFRYLNLWCWKWKQDYVVP